MARFLETVDTDMRWIGAEIRRAREARGWILKDLSAATGYSVQYLSEIERGEASGLAIQKFLTITRVLGLQWTRLLYLHIQEQAQRGLVHVPPPTSSVSCA